MKTLLSPIPTEHEEQVAYFEWVRMMRNQDKRYNLIFAIPNAGKRSYGALAYYLAEGLEKGVPDVFISVPIGLWHGLYLEFKRKPNKASPEQVRWGNMLIEQDYSYVLCWNCDEAMSVTRDYLSTK